MPRPEKNQAFGTATGHKNIDTKSVAIRLHLMRYDKLYAPVTERAMQNDYSQAIDPVMPGSSMGRGLAK